MLTNAVLEEMRALRDRVIGVTDTALASRDGLIMQADTTDIDLDNVAALAAASLGVAQRMAAEVGKDMLRESMIRSSGGYVAVYAVGAAALLIVVGDAGLDRGRLDREARAAVEAIGALLPGARAGHGPRAAASLSPWPQPGRAPARPAGRRAAAQLTSRPTDRQPGGRGPGDVPGPAREWAARGAG